MVQGEAVSGGHSWTNERKEWWQVVASAIRKLEMIRHIEPATIHPTPRFDCPTPGLYRWSCKVLRVKIVSANNSTSFRHSPSLSHLCSASHPIISHALSTHQMQPIENCLCLLIQPDA